MTGGTGRGVGAPRCASGSPRAWSRVAAGPGGAGARAGGGEGSSRARRRKRTRRPGRRHGDGIFLAGGGRTSAQGPPDSPDLQAGGRGRGPWRGQDRGLGLGGVRVPGDVAAVLKPDEGRPPGAGSRGCRAGVQGEVTGSGQGPGGAELDGARVPREGRGRSLEGGAWSGGAGS